MSLDLNAAFAKLMDADAHAGAGRAAEALAGYEIVAEASANDGLLLHEAAMGFARLGAFAKARTLLARAAELSPEIATIWSNLGNAHLELNELDDAQRAMEKAAALEPKAATFHNLACVAERGSKLMDAIAHRRHLRTLDANFTHGRDILAGNLVTVGLAKEAMAAFDDALAPNPQHPGMLGSKLFAMSLVPGMGAADILAAHRTWENCVPSRTPVYTNTREPERRLRVGYMSADFRNHACAAFMLPLLENRDPANVETFCYAQLDKPDAVTGRVRGAADNWRDIGALHDDAVARLITADGIDILVDLAGHTAGNRLAVFALRPAPVQATWLGYGGSTGLSAVNYKISDAVIDPPGVADAHYSEKIMRLPRLSLYYRPLIAAPAPKLPEGPPTFISCNALHKVNPETIALWAHVLRAVPGSKLLLKAKPLEDDGVRADVAKRFTAHGVAEAVEMHGLLADTAAHFEFYSRAHVALDTFPYNGGTTTCEALWMGVPVVTMRGERATARFSEAIMDTVGLKGFAAHDAASFVKLAAATVMDSAKLADMRGNLRARMEASPLCDGPGFARAMEGAFRNMWREWCGMRA